LQAVDQRSRTSAKPEPAKTTRTQLQSVDVADEKSNARANDSRDD
jgi:hypothetical protein